MEGDTNKAKLDSELMEAYYRCSLERRGISLEQYFENPCLFLRKVGGIMEDPGVTTKTGENQ